MAYRFRNISISKVFRIFQFSFTSTAAALFSVRHRYFPFPFIRHNIAHIKSSILFILCSRTNKLFVSFCLFMEKTRQKKWCRLVSSRHTTWKSNALKLYSASHKSTAEHKKKNNTIFLPSYSHSMRDICARAAISFTERTLVFSSLRTDTAADA